MQVSAANCGLNNKGIEMATSRAPRRRPNRSPQQRRPSSAPVRSVEPPNYSRDYAFVRRDLLLIALIGGLLLAGMIATSFFF